jgi:tight adherence protein B
MDTLYYIFGTLIFIAVVLLIEGVYLTWNSSKGPEAERIARRLRVLSAGGHTGEQNNSIIKKRLLSNTPRVQRFLLEVPRVSALDRMLVQSGMSWSVAKFLGITLTACVVTYFAASYFALPLAFCVGLAVAAAGLPYQLVKRATAKRLHRIEMQLPDALDLMSRALRAGHAFPTALKMVGDEMNDPLASEFRAAFDEVNFGISIADALMSLATRVPFTDLRYFVIAVLIQRETGGNLSELLDSISAIVRERIKLLGQVKVLSAEGKLSAWILGLLPFGAGAMIQITNPQFLDVLFSDPGGQKMLMGAAAMMVFGVFAMRNIIRIRV